MAILLQGKQADLDSFGVNRILHNPHIGLAAITYMLAGRLLHRDSLGNNIEILPGDVNWMMAGRGIVHSK